MIKRHFLVLKEAKSLIGQILATIVHDNTLFFVVKTADGRFKEFASTDPNYEIQEADHDPKAK